MRKWNHITDTQAENLARALEQTHNPALTSSLIEYFHERMQDGAHYSRDALEVFVRPIFARLQKAKCSPAVAFGFKREKGKHPRHEEEDLKLMTTAIVVQIMRQGATKEAAITDAASILGVSNETVGRYIKELYGLVQIFPDEVLNSLAPLDSLSAPTA